MVKRLIFLLLPILYIALSGCKRENLDDCFTNSGEVIIKERPTAYFDRVRLNDNINLVIKEGDQFKIQIEGGKNLLDAVKTETVDSVLSISNTMKCNWVRDYDHEITVYITSPSLWSIYYEGSGDVRTDGNINMEHLELNVWGGAGSINLDLDCNTLNLGLHYGTTDFHVKGNSSMMTIYANSYGPFFCEEMNSNIVYIKNSGTNDCYIHVNHILEAELSSIGNIYYSGNPSDLKCNETGSGRLIKLSE
jgi:hypothetical protein